MAKQQDIHVEGKKVTAVVSIHPTYGERTLCQTLVQHRHSPDMCMTLKAKGS